jgi:hypothetical protein
MSPLTNIEESRIKKRIILKDSYWTLHRASWIQSTPSYRNSWTSITTLPPAIYVWFFQVILSLQVLQPKIIHVPHVCYMSVSPNPPWFNDFNIKLINQLTLNGVQEGGIYLKQEWNSEQLKCDPGLAPLR